MAEQEKDHHHTAEDKGPEAQSTHMANVSSFDECKQDKTDIVKLQPSEDSTLSTSTNEETNNDNVVQPDVKNSTSAEEGMVPPIERSSPPEDHTALNVKDNSNPEEGSRGDYEREMPRNEQKPMTAEISREYPPEEKKAPDTTLDDKKDDDQVDGPDDEETPDSNAINPDAEEDESSPEKEDEDIPDPTRTNEEVENIGPTINGKRGMTYLIAVGLLGLGIALLWPHLFQTKSPPQKDGVWQIDTFRRQLEEVKTQFPNQRAALWQRSKIHMLRHLQTAQPTEPVSLILTAGHRGEKTLHCLAQRLAFAFSSSLNGSVLDIDGASKASQDSDQVKLDIDSKLQGAFEGDQPVAVIHRFEELPPGSTLIFYRYCDHENAAYKKTCLIFTVLLGEEEEIPAETRLSTVEELVDDQLQKKFLSDGHPVSFDRMDLDKYSGLWSRISHLILPVAAEERIEREGC
ncbi:torsin-1A-interacting protein 2-like isoform X1 [Pseudoliparis swirei]|uniref:torsin-1A-interacting protein 2-like isoform X1 n=1 Tax=Pseudoliparis swirei TaxID=2059687 RepID=UPI0024BDD9D2|nr:torsin-1A-interacting protein 2-like isoform X1 [Pseudoliparis swirei]